MDTLIRESCALWQLPVTDEIRAAVGAFVAQALENRLILGYSLKP
jgi:hypothetical protein